ncbi:hypothetical protein Zmor_002925 [Zophobas morio]|uniref:Uncharacterized protein n=1 Tax=Zophobas morio TaxID=2755281 RepID=A0AA38HLS8_9CUCU|nr:hypothetical protein Zmor_002925 [Zophobas morio]
MPVLCGCYSNAQLRVLTSCYPSKSSATTLIISPYLQRYYYRYQVVFTVAIEKLICRFPHFKDINMGTIKQIEQDNLFMQSCNDCLMPLKAPSIGRAVVLRRTQRSLNFPVQFN